MIKITKKNAVNPAIRIKMLPHTDWFMRGAVYGHLVAKGKKWHYVVLDNVDKVIPVSLSSYEYVN